MLVMLCAGMLTLAVKIQPVRAATITVPDDYKTIQDAVNHAHSGDTVYVRNGIYTEHVYINKTITLKGEGNEKTIIEAHKSNQSDFGAGGVSISSSNTVLENFRIVPPNSTVPLEIPTLVFIDGRVASCSNDTIRNCVFVFPNDVGAGSDAIDVFDSPNSTITGNKITIADPSDAGIAVIEGSVNCLVDNNSITGGWLGIAIDFADNNIVSNNYVADENNLYGGALYMAITSGDTVKTNVLVNNTLAIKLASSVYDSSIYHNNFKNNALQVYIDADSARIAWDNG